MGDEFRGKGAHVALGYVPYTMQRANTILNDGRPVAGPLGRHALGGRNWEGFSPDPYLTAVAANLTLRGLQSSGGIL